ncbi:MAG: UDP-2,3-diacylglucosamine diphosphatase [Bacteroidales bacterium]|nr:UDP-2,3-diacylglucosamine diphosphatase [Bacteroidales bacterium]
MDIAKGRYYFTADVHLGMSEDPQGLRQQSFVDFLNSLPAEAEELHLLGDIFDFWIDYKDVAPRGYVRVLAALAALVERGVKVFFYPGNHDWWVTDYFEKELGVKIVRGCWSVMELDGRRICVGHGDMPGATDFRSRFFFRLFRNRFLIGGLKMLHPRFVFWLARKWTASSRSKHSKYVKRFGNDIEKTGLFRFADDFGRSRAESSQPAIELYIFGHIHTPARVSVPSGGELVVLGDWSQGPQYLSL